jgi:hypothetical protein
MKRGPSSSNASINPHREPDNDEAIASPASGLLFVSAAILSDEDGADLFGWRCRGLYF